MLEGWYFYLGGKEYFCETSRQNKSKGLLEGILWFLNKPVTEGNLEYLKSILLKANLEVKWLPDTPDLGVKGHHYYNIWGNNFYGYGSNDINDGKTIVFQLKGDEVKA